MTDLIDILQVDHLVSQQTQRPALLPFWGGTTRQRNEMGFFLPGDAPTLWACLRILAAQGGIQPLFREALFDANDGATTDLKHLGDLLIAGWWPALAAIQLE